MFVTTNVKNRNKLFQDPAFASQAIECLYKVQQFHPFYIFGFVIMPDHCHFLLNVPWPNSISKVMRIYKISVVFELGIGSFWQPRFHIVFPKKPFQALQYIHANPVKAGLSDMPEKYPWSSAAGKWDVSIFESAW